MFEVRDLWPESLAAVVMGNENSLLHHGLAAVTRFLYERADRIVVVTPAFKQHLIERWRVPEQRIAFVENGVQADLFAPQPPVANLALRQQLGAEGKFLVCYAGTMGMAHGLETLLDAATQLQAQNTEVMFLLIGEGAEKERIESRAQDQSLRNVHFLDQHGREKVPALISVCSSQKDRCLQDRHSDQDARIHVLLAPSHGKGRPSGAADCRRIWRGIVVEPENAAELAQAINQLAANPAHAAALGKKEGNTSGGTLLAGRLRRSTSRFWKACWNSGKAAQPNQRAEFEPEGFRPDAATDALYKS